MRMIGSLPDEPAARAFGDYLLTQGIDSSVEESSGGYLVWVEHGHQYDFCNRFEVLRQARWTDEHPPIMDGRDGVPRLLECDGTRFLLRYMNRLESIDPEAKLATVQPGIVLDRVRDAAEVHEAHGRGEHHGAAPR